MPRRRVFGSLLALVFLVNLARVVFAPLVDPLMGTFDVGPGAAGLVASLAWFGSGFSRLPTGWVLTRVSRQRVVLVSGLLLAVAAFGSGFAPSIGWLGLGSFLMGTASGAYFIAANPLLSELFPTRVGRALGIHGTAGQIAAVLAAPIVGVALFVDGYRVVFLAMSAIALVATAIFYYVVRNADLPEAGAADRDLVGAIRAQWPLIITGIAIIGTTGFAWNGVFNFYVTYLRIVKDIPPEMGRHLLTVMFGAGVPAFWIAGRLADRLPFIPLLMGLLVGVVAGFVALTQSTGLLALVLVSLWLGFLVHSMFPAIDTYLLSTLPDDNRASAYSAYSATMMLVQSGGSSAVGSLTETGIPFDSVFIGFAAGLCLVIVAISGLYRGGRLPG